jgi:hypothetical protein
LVFSLKVEESEHFSVLISSGDTLEARLLNKVACPFYPDCERIRIMIWLGLAQKDAIV